PVGRRLRASQTVRARRAGALSDFEGTCGECWRAFRITLPTARKSCRNSSGRRKSLTLHTNFARASPAAKKRNFGERSLRAEVRLSYVLPPPVLLWRSFCVSELLKTFDIFGRKEYVSGGND